MADQFRARVGPPPRSPAPRPPTSRLQAVGNWLATLVLVLSVPGLLVPLVYIRGAGPALAYSGTPFPGSTLTVSGAAFDAKAQLQLLWDGTPVRGAIKASPSGTFRQRLTISNSATLGAHTVSAASAGSNRQRGAPTTPLASMTVVVVSQADAPSPSAAATATARPTVAPTVTPVVTSAPTPIVTPPPPRPPTPAPTAPPPTTGWVTVINDQFDAGGVPSHWSLYNGPYGSGPHNCAIPSHASVSGGSLHLLMSHESSGICGAGWYTAGMMIGGAYGSVDQRVTVRFRVVSNGVDGHRIIPMRWPTSAAWPAGGEEDYCEGDSLTGCDTFLHYSSANQQIYHPYSFSLAQWHTIRVQRLNHVVMVFLDDLGTPVWTYLGSSATLPDTAKRVVLQQECQSSCPSGTSGSEDIQIDWITIENPA